MDNLHDTGPAKRFLKMIEDAEHKLHTGLRFASAPQGASLAELKAFSRLKYSIKAQYDRLEELRMDLDEWISDYDEMTNGPAPRK
jgi:hypothetical protein